MRRLFSITVLLFVLLILVAAEPSTLRAAEAPLEYKLKAAFLLNFAKFTRWPEKESKTNTFNLCLVGADPLGSAAKSLSGKLVGKRPFEMTVFKDAPPAAACDMIFLSRSAEVNTAELITPVGGQSMLTVSDRKNFASQGGIIELLIFNDRLGFIINNTRAKKDGISLSASLLDLAQEVL